MKDSLCQKNKNNIAYVNMLRLENQFVSFPYKMKLIQLIINSDAVKEGSQKAFWESYLLKIFNLPLSLRQDFE